MAKSSSQKGKLIKLLGILFRQSDEEHPIAVPRLIQLLEAEGIPAERKSVYDDIEVLRSLDYDIQLQRTRGYFLGERLFQLAELKLLVDAVQSSKFITAKKSNQLIEKLEKLTSRHQGQELQRQVFVAGRIKSMNESVYYTIDAIHQAISENRQITFQYFRYAPDRQKVLRHDGKVYQVSPYALLRSDENYYLVAYDPASDQIRHYRVDKMVSIQRSEHRREGMEVYQSFDLGRYARLHFGMFRGQEAAVRLRCENRMADVIIDRFGDQVALIPDGPDHFLCSVELAVSPQFFGWLFGLGASVVIQGPDWVREAMEAQLAEVAGGYGKV
ncbi:MAG: WYL domain-containing protein [Oscillospiraceae bacterium]|nr:WYL domain-containing protein [Oscillospiraceae bacterium]